MKRKLREEAVTARGEEEVIEEVSVKRKINFDTEAGTDTDDEVIFDTQAHKRRKMSQEIVELKVWMEGNFTEASNNSSQIEKIIQTNSHRSIKNEEDIGSLRHAINRIESNMSGCCIISHFFMKIRNAMCEWAASGP